MKSLNEKALMFRFLAGLADSGEVMKYIWENYSRGILFYISRFFPRDSMKSEDILQEVMLKVYRSLESFNPFYSLSTWLYTITRNQCIDSMRVRSEEFSRQTDDIDISSTSCVCSAEEDFFRDELRCKVDSAFRSLEVREQEIVYLKFFEDRNFRQIAEITGINHSTVKQIFHRAERILYERLKDYEKD